VSVTFADQPMFGAGVLAAPAGSASDLLCWFHRREMIEALTTGFDGNAGDGISANERSAREHDLKARLLDLERAEESLIEQALAASLDVHRRTNASPFAILGLGTALAVAAVPMAAE
jgi:hypothetical protein